MNSRGQNPDSWHLDKRFPVAVILAILLQIVTLVWCAASINAAVSDHERRIVAIEHYQESAMTGPSGMSERLTRLEEKVSTSQKSLDRIEDKLSAATTPAIERNHR